MSGGADPVRAAAYEVLRRCFEHDAWADRAFPAAAERHGLQGSDRARAQWLAYGAVQRRGTSDAIVRRLAGRRARRLDAPVRAALRLGLFELLFAERAADHAAVDAAVELAKAGMQPRGARRAKAAAGLVNAVLRRAAGDRGGLLASLRDDDPEGAAAAHSVPLWLAEMWFSELGADSARALLWAVNRPAETALRVNTLRADVSGITAALRAAGEATIARNPARRRTGVLWPPEALVVEGRLGPMALERLARAELFAQSRAAQAVVELLDPRPGERVLDLCAGPGLKTAAIAARLQGSGSVVAVERDPGRARQLSELCERAGAANVEVVRADAREHDPGSGYDRVLVDPPCSDLGTLASRPDARWRKSPAAIAELAAIQREILGRGLEALAPGGSLVYSTCTISRRENEDVVAAALADRDDPRVDPLGDETAGLGSPHDARFAQTRPDRDGTDGFFYARLRRGA